MSRTELARGRRRELKTAEEAEERAEEDEACVLCENGVFRVQEPSMRVVVADVGGLVAVDVRDSD